ncbi:MAG: AAA family ATPase [Bacteroidetes bacterium]|nr:AAA family ATPase [Bacteroidota bacterium]
MGNIWPPSSTLPSAKGSFWKQGSYLWEVYAEGVKICDKKFYINKVGLVTNQVNPYLKINSVKFYTGTYNGVNENDRVYLSVFSKKNTQYVWTEIIFENLSNNSYYYEFQLNFYDDAGIQKASIMQDGYVEQNKAQLLYTFERGWGSQEPGVWVDDKYFLEIVFNDVRIAAASFECGEEDVKGETPLLSTAEQIFTNTQISEKPNNNEASTSEKNLEELLLELENLIGLESVKKSIRENISYLNFVKLRKEKGFDDSNKITLHSIFTGNPGTGKTTIVKLLSKIYYKMGLIKNNTVIEADRASLVGEYIGQTAPKTKKIIEQAKGGILFIDEAYSLARSGDDSRDFGKEVIEILLKEMSEGTNDVAIIVAGYPKEMTTFIDSNPGLKSRFTQSFYFEDYLPEELLKIANFAATHNKINFTTDSQNFLLEQFTNLYRTRSKDFGNARFVYGIIENAKHEMALRLMSNPNVNELSNEELSQITLSDLQKVFDIEQKKKLTLLINEKDLAEALNELNALIGIETVKKNINDLVKLIRFYNDTGKDALNKISLHAIFTGNAGTGKTTVARIIAKIYKALGIVEKGQLIEVDREDLVAGYIGQTAIKTSQKIDEAMGGVLFIDEAYGLTSDGNNFGSEAIQIILKRMEDFRGKFGIIAAGYTQNMKEFIESNPGLKSRFDKIFLFEGYTSEQLWDIVELFLGKEKLKVELGAAEYLKKYLNDIYNHRDAFFGNARFARKMVDDIIFKQNLRVASIPVEERNQFDLNTILIEDVAHLKYSDDKPSKTSLGFKFNDQ